jgi:hypothetical protein
MQLAVNQGFQLQSMLACKLVRQSVTPHTCRPILHLHQHAVQVCTCMCIGLRSQGQVHTLPAPPAPAGTGTTGGVLDDVPVGEQQGATEGSKGAVTL